ncbi:Eukaryotic translation initiation factor 2A [Neolecta irregularis DAH-3]|uniref:Eukaryotic translation initiation factor 2A n=1 Tax=Neolecta irregularis (strain DAH-3) TaxID=1198029 RepID=A0A1U7LJU6_NEOID|nr:Eukaryotic translation initiation factor 2A [Neolecta irregularis DAH-3]|eukprot:OLL22822.1 Eukaryotic translation initiation factor 2A [Neolecta irregularis DAH-3]
MSALNISKLRPSFFLLLVNRVIFVTLRPVDPTMPSTQFAFRTSKRIGLTNAHPDYKPVAGLQQPEGHFRAFTYSPDGRYSAFASVENRSVSIILTEDGSVANTLPVKNVYEIGFSPQGSYVITWQRASKDESGNATKNLKIFRVLSGEQTASFVQKSQNGWCAGFKSSSDRRRNLQFTYDEEFCARVVTNEVQFYKSSEMEKGVWNKLRVEGVSEFALSPGKNHAVAVFVPEKKGQPAIVRVYNVPQFASSISQKTFFKADKVKFMWNHLGTSLLVLTQTDVDTTNKSYYGESNLYLLGIAGQYDCRVVLDKEGPIHDVSWSTNSKEFGVVYDMPAKTTFFDHRANAIKSLPLAPRNTILYSPHARFIIVAGFGNLQGTMDIYDRERNLTKVSTIEASNTSICEWSPDGRHIMTATTSPRLRVDNGVKIFHYTGSLIFTEEMEELYEVTWKPQTPDIHPLRGLSPAPTPHSSVSSISSKTPPKPQGAYRPPHARGSAVPLHYKREDEGGLALANGVVSSTNDMSIPGAPELDKQLSKNAQKNKKKREAAKKTKETEQHVSEVVEPSQAMPADGLDLSTISAEDGKKIRALTKKLKAVEDLKLRLANGDKLEATQVKKIETEDQLRKDLAALGIDA